MERSKRSVVPVFVHVVVWTLFGNLLLLYGPLTWDIQIPLPFWIKQGVVFVSLIALYYFNARLLVPRFLFAGKTAVFVLLIIGLTVFLMFFYEWMESALHVREAMEKAMDGMKHYKKNSRVIPFNGFLFLMVGTVLGISTSIKSIQKTQHDSELRLQLEQQKTASELAYLKAQINPHFFFNTLNNIYALTLIDAEHSRQALHKLSRMMRYLLYETQNDSTLLSKEIAFIKDYIELMKLRVNENITVLFEEPAQLEDKSVSPMLFLPYVENAFKHGISSVQNGHIYIFFRQNAERTQMEVVNTVFNDKPASLEEGSGIGLNNTSRRLDLLYPGKYTLKSGKTPDESEYRVKLNLYLS
ncbi:MAG: histidine kinase [Mucilaginibacter polytrichastri]|nr:histidine kinase [Mucilaginibacter polytrichastri]